MHLPLVTGALLLLCVSLLTVGVGRGAHAAPVESVIGSSALAGGQQEVLMLRNLTATVRGEKVLYGCRTVKPYKLCWKQCTQDPETLCYIKTRNKQNGFTKCSKDTDCSPSKPCNTPCSHFFADQQQVN